METLLEKNIRDIVALTPADLVRQDIADQMVEVVYEYERTARFGDLSKLVNFFSSRLTHDFERAYPERAQLYRSLLIWTKFVVLHLLPDDDVEQLMAKHLLEGFDLEIDIRQRIKLLFQQSWDPYLRGEKRDRLLKAFSENEQQLWPGKLELGNGRMAPATVSNILLDYNRFAKSDEPRGSLEQASYLDRSPNTKGLTESNRARVLQIIQLYDFVRYPPIEEMAREQVVSPLIQSGPKVPGAKRALPDEPLQIPGQGVPLSATIVDPMERLKIQYQTYRAKRRPVLDAEDALMVGTGGDVQALKRELAAASRNREKYRLIACLKILAREQALVTAVQSSPAWQQATADFVVRKYRDEISDRELPLVQQQAKSRADLPQVLAEFLQYLLREKLEMSQNDSALVGVEIGQLLGGSFEGMAYGNQQTGEFEWARYAVRDGQLVPR